jgi:ABC-2 type transport system ATP-binding protein
MRSKATKTKGRPLVEPAAAMILIEGLTYRYPSRVALDGVSFDVRQGELFGLLGPNGSGKSTLLRILTGLRRPASGSATIAGVDVTRKPAAVRHRLGVAFQSPSLDGKLSVRENLRFQGYLFGMAGARLSARIGEMLAHFGLEERQRERVETLSGGMKRRVELAKALLHGPPVLLLDEPSTGLDPAARLEFWQVLEQMRKREGLTVVVATHLMDEAERCERVALLDQGRLMVVDTPKALKAALGGETVTLETANPEQLAGHIRKKYGFEPVISGNQVRIGNVKGMATARKLLDAFDGDVRAVTVGHPTLEDVFLARTGRGLDGEEEGR